MVAFSLSIQTARGPELSGRMRKTLLRMLDSVTRQIADFVQAQVLPRSRAISERTDLMRELRAIERVLRHPRDRALRIVERRHDFVDGFALAADRVEVNLRSAALLPPSYNESPRRHRSSAGTPKKQIHS